MPLLQSGTFCCKKRRLNIGMRRIRESEGLKYIHRFLNKIQNAIGENMRIHHVIINHTCKVTHIHSVVSVCHVQRQFIKSIAGTLRRSSGMVHFVKPN